MALERLRRCPKEVANEFWPAGKPKKRGRPRKNPSPSEESSPPEEAPEDSNPAEEAPSAAECSEEPSEILQDRGDDPPPERVPPDKGKYTGRLRSHPKKKSPEDG